MVAIVSGNGLGLFNTSLNTLGGAGTFGQTNLGQSNGKAYVNASNGNLILQADDKQMSGLSQIIQHLRTYNAEGTLTDGDADGWRWDGERKLILTGSSNSAGSYVTRITGDGHQTVYSWNGSAYVSNEGSGAYDKISYWLISQNPLGLSPEWIWTDGSTQSTETYDGTTGLLKAVINQSNQKTTYTYNATGRLTNVKDDSGDELVLTYNAAGRLDRLDTRNASGGALTRQVYYGYDTSGRLTSVTTDLTPNDNSISDGNTYVTSYTYSGTSYRIASISQSDGTSASFTYVLVGSDYRVASVTDDSGTTTFSYDTVNRRTDVTNGMGQVWSFSYDSNGQLINVQTPSVNGQRITTSYAYDANGNVTQITDGRGNAVSYQYDGSGNKILERDALGNTIKRIYSSANELLNEIHYSVPATYNAGAWTNPPDSSAVVTRYIYDLSHRVRYVVSAVGNVTEYRYNLNGLRTQEIQYLGGTYSVVGGLVAGPGPNDTLNTTLMLVWVATQDQSKTRQTAYTYDARGNLTKSETYNTVNLLGLTTEDSGAEIYEYVYSEYGQLLQTIVDRGSGRTTKYTLSSTVYDGLGRVLSQVDSTGTKTNSYNGSSRQITITSSSGEIVTTAYDANGRIVSITQAGPSVPSRTVQYVYDANGRQTMVQDATGIRTYTLYDEAGRVSARVDGVGAVTEYVYNGDGQVVKTTRYAAIVDTSTWYNGTVVTKTLINQIRPTTSTADRITYAVYDAAGRVSVSIEGPSLGLGGRVTAFTYDGVGNLLGTVRYSASLANNTLPSRGYYEQGDINSSVISGDALFDQSTRYFYDADGRQVGILDGEGYLSESTYDSGGRLISVTRYGTQTTVPNSANYASLTLNGVRPTSGSNLSTRYYYDNAGHQIGCIDENNYVTATTRDEAGNTLTSIRYANPYTAAATDIPLLTTFATIQSSVSNGAKQTTTTAYDGFGRVSKITANDGTVTAYEYDTSGRLVRTTEAAGATDGTAERSLRTRYDAFGRVTGQLGGKGSAQILAGMSNSQIDAIYAQYGTTYTYDASGRQTSMTDEVGNRTVYFYDADGRLVDTVRADGSVTETTYNAFGDAIKSSNLNGKLSGSNVQALAGGFVNTSLTAMVQAIRNAAMDSTVSYVYDNLGRLITKTDAEGLATNYSYTIGEQIGTIFTQLSSSASTIQTIGYDRRGKAIESIEDFVGLHRRTTTVYDAFGRVVQKTDGMGNATSTLYDLSGRKITVTDALGHAHSSTYDAWGRTLAETDALNKTTTYGYDDVNRVITITTPDNATISKTMDRHGEVIKLIDGNHNVTTYSYDADGNLTQTLDALNHSSTQGFDNAGRLTSQVDAAGNLTQYSYDAANHLVQRIDALGNYTTYAFDGQGRQVLVTEASNSAEAQRVTQYSFDRKGQVLKVIRDLNGINATTTYAYDGVGNQVRVSQGDANNPVQRVTRYIYDNLNQRRFEVDALGDVTQYEYDAAGRAIKTTKYAKALSGSAVSGLDTASDAVQSIQSLLVTDAADQIHRMVYDAADRLVYSFDPVGALTENQYDSNDRLLKTIKYAVTNWADLNWLDVTSNRIQAVQARILTNSADQATSMTYDATGRVQSVKDAAGYTESYTYDANGNRITLTNKLQKVWNYKYDALNRMIEEVTPAVDVGLTATTHGTRYVVTVLTYDEVGNVKSRTEGRLRVSLTDDASIDDLSQARTTLYSYDKLGRQTRIVSPGYYSSSTGKFLAANDGNSQQLTTDITYDALGRAVRNSVAGNNSYKVYDKLDRAIYDVDSQGGVTGYTYDSLGNQTSIRRYATAMTAAAPSRGYFLGGDISSSLVVNAASDRTLTMTYDAAGHKTSVQQNMVNTFTFTYPNTITSANTLASPTTLYSYNALGQLVRETQISRDANGNTLQTGTSTTYFYDKNNHQTGIVDGLGYYTKIDFDVLGRQVLKSEYATALTGWDGVSIPNSVATNGKDRITQYRYDAMDRVISSTLSNVSYFTTWDSGWVDSLGTSTQYDALGAVTAQTDAAGNIQYTFYDSLGRVSQVTEADRTLFIPHGYDGIPFVINETDRPVTTYTRNAFGQVLTETRGDALNSGSVKRVTATSYDAAGYVIGSTDATGASISYTVDIMGRRLSERQHVVAYLGTWSSYDYTIKKTYAYDSLGQQTATLEWYGSNSYTQDLVAYNRFGEVIGHYLNGNQQAAYTYDQAGRVIQTVDAHGTTTTDYDFAGHATRSTNIGATSAANRITVTTFDLLGRAVTQILPGFSAVLATDTINTTTLTFTTPTLQQGYDRWGNVLYQTDARGYSTFYTYDKSNRVLTRTLPITDVVREDGTTYKAWTKHEYRYDKIGDVVQELDWALGSDGNNTVLRTRRHAYNAVGQLVQDIDALGYSKYYKVDIDGNRVATQDEIGLVTIDDLDAMGRVVTHSVLLSDGSGGRILTALKTNKYDQAGRLYAEINGIQETDENLDYGYLGTAGNTRYTLYDERGNVAMTRNESGVVKAYSYNADNRKIQEVDAMGNSLFWSYDSYGRMSTHKDLAGRQYTYSYNEFGQLSGEQLIENGVTMPAKAYDYWENGLLKAVRETDTRTFSSFNALVRTSSYKYDASGNRVSESNSAVWSTGSASTETRYQFDEQSRLAVTYTLGGQTLDGVRGSEIVTGVATGKVTYSFDELGNRRRVQLNTTGQSGIVTTKDQWFRYDNEDRVIIGEGRLINGKIVAGWTGSLAYGYINSYDGAGHLFTSLTAKGSADFVYNGTTYSNGGIYQQQYYGYDDLGHLTDIQSNYLLQQNPSDSNEVLKVASSYRAGFTNGAWVSNDKREDFGAEYDNNGYQKRAYNWTYAPNGTESTYSVTSSFYRGDGLLAMQRMSKSVNGGSLNTQQETYLNEGGMVDAAGNQLAYRYVVYNADGTVNYRGTTTNTLALYDGYKNKTTTATWDRAGSSGLTTMDYSPRGVLQRVSGTAYNRSYASNADGQVISRREANGTAQNYLYYQGAEVASIGNAVTPDLSTTYKPLSSDYPGRTPSTYVIAPGDTLARIAQMLWGDVRMWYLIADANGLTQGSSDALPASQTLKIPNVVQSTHNDATTFKAYSPGDTIGDTTPSPQPPPPPSRHCGILLQAIVIVVAIVATIYTAGAASASLGAAFGATAGTVSTASVAAGAIGAAVGAAAGSVASQLTANAVGLQSGFSWSAVGRAALIGGVTAGVTQGLGLVGGPNIPGGLSDAIKAGDWSGAAGYSIAQNVVGQGVGMALGVQPKFSWASVAAAAVGGAFDSQFGTGASVQEPGRIGTLLGANAGGGFLSQFARGVVTNGVQVLVNGHGKLDFAEIAADAFGNVLGNSLDGARQRTEANSKLKDIYEKSGVDYATDKDGNVIANSGSVQRAARALVGSGTSVDKIVSILGDTGVKTAFNGIDSANAWIAANQGSFTDALDNLDSSITGIPYGSDVPTGAPIPLSQASADFLEQSGFGSVRFGAESIDPAQGAFSSDNPIFQALRPVADAATALADLNDRFSGLADAIVIAGQAVVGGGGIGQAVVRLGKAVAGQALDYVSGQAHDFVVNKLDSYLGQNTDLSPLARGLISQAGGFGVDAVFGTVAGISSNRVIGDAGEVRSIQKRLPQDINVNPSAPRPLPLGRPIGRSASQNAELQADIARAQAEGARDIRVNQQQVNAAGQRVGTNRPDLQYTDVNGKRVYSEYDTNASSRGPGHKARIQANDPDSTVLLKRSN